jgi:hypothetical protein
LSPAIILSPDKIFVYGCEPSQVHIPNIGLGLPRLGCFAMDWSLSLILDQH